MTPGGMTSTNDVPVTPRWLHWWAILTVCATLPLLFLGAEVTTKGVGMADPQGFRPPWELIEIMARDWFRLDIRIEYSHRLAGMVVGTCVIVLLIGLWLAEPRRGVRWLGVLALLLICIQGALGIFRVDLNAYLGRTLALIHGLFAQIVVATLVCLAVVTSRGWARAGSDWLGRWLLPSLAYLPEDGRTRAEPTPEFRHWTIFTAVVIIVQLILGGMTRHQDFLFGPRAHLLGAFGVVACVAVLVRMTFDRDQGDGVSGPIFLLAGLVLGQVFLGVETWLSKLSVASTALPQVQPLSADPEFLSWLRSGHYVLGTMIFATSVVLVLKAHRRSVTKTAAPLLEAAL